MAHWPSPSAGASGVRFYIRTDGMDAIENPVNGLLYDSRSAYYRAVRDAGCEIVGNERPKRVIKKPPPVGPDIKRAIEQLQSR
ncbi:MAG: hypothetical protein ACOY71_08385 [Gemmatimonadota bacterium]